jgi:hypothetical protein
MLLVYVVSPQAGFKAGYQKGVQVQVTVSVDLDDDSGSYLRRQQSSRQAGSSCTSTGPKSSSSNSSISNSSSSQQPWLPQSRSTVSNRRGVIRSCRWQLVAVTQLVCQGSAHLACTLSMILWGMFLCTLTIPRLLAAAWQYAK